MSIAEYLDRDCGELHPLDRDGREVSFARSHEICEVVCPIPGELEMTSITDDTEDDNIDALALHLVTVNPIDSITAAQVAEYLKQVRDAMQSQTH